MNDDEANRLEAFLNAGSEIAGNATGAALSVGLSGLTGGIAGALAGPITTRLIQSQARDFAARALSQGEQKRVAGVLDIAASHIDHKLKLGYEPRHDDFFEGEPGDRSFAEEIAEGVLIAAQRQHEERKLPYIGYMLANIAFDPGIDRPTANLMIQLAESLTYRQLVLLAALADKETLGIKPGLVSAEGKVSFQSLVYLQELSDLYRRGLAFTEGGGFMLDVATLSPGSLVVRGSGAVLHSLMELRRIEDSERKQVAAGLRSDIREPQKEADEPAK